MAAGDTGRCPHDVGHRTRMVRLTDEQRLDRKMTEAQLNSRVAYRTKKHGWTVLRLQRALVGGAWRTPATKGFPDLLLVGPRLMFRELKRELGKLDEAQETWRDRLRAAGADWDVWRPSDLRTGRIERELMSLTYVPMTAYIVQQNDNIAPSDGAQ